MTVEEPIKEKSKRSGELVIRPADPVDAETLWKIIDSCSDKLVSMGLDHWKKYYTRELIKKKLKKQKVFLASRDKQPLATITLDSNPVDYYTDQDMSTFADKAASALYVTALAVLPVHQGQGIASQLMQFTEDEAIRQNIPFIRFDCRASYKDLVGFYQKRGFKIVGTLIDDADNNEPYYLMEKKIDAQERNRHNF